MPDSLTPKGMQSDPPTLWLKAFVTISKTRSQKHTGIVGVTFTDAWSQPVSSLLQVIAGSGLDVGFALISPRGYQLVSDFRRSDGIHMCVDYLSAVQQSPAADVMPDPCNTQGNQLATSRHHSITQESVPKDSKPDFSQLITGWI